MPPVEGRQWALVVFGTPLVLVGLVAVGYVGLFVVPGGPCHGGGDLAVPNSEVAVAFDGSAVTVVYADEQPLGGSTTDRVVVGVRDAETGETVSRQWIDGGERLSRGDTLTLSGQALGVDLTDADEVTVRWYGVDRDVAGFCPNGRTFGDLRRVQLVNASVLVET